MMCHSNPAFQLVKQHALSMVGAGEKYISNCRQLCNILNPLLQCPTILILITFVPSTCTANVQQHIQHAAFSVFSSSRISSTTATQEPSLEHTNQSSAKSQRSSRNPHRKWRLWHLS